MSKNFPELQSCDAALVKNNQINAFGNGEIGRVGFVVIDNIAGKTTAEDIIIGFENIRAIDVEMNELAVTGMEGSLTVGITDISQSSLHIYPNPVSDGILNIITSDNQKVNVLTITDLVGKIVFTAENIESSVKLADLKAGQYIIEIESGDNYYTDKLLIIE
jgi:hypothetical protein